MKIFQIFKDQILSFFSINISFCKNISFNLQHFIQFQHLNTTNVNLSNTYVQKAEPVEAPKDKPKAKKASKAKYEELPEIPDYERPDLEKYDKSDFDPTKKVIQLTTILFYYLIVYFDLSSKI